MKHVLYLLLPALFCCVWAVPESSVEFERHVIDAEFPNGYQVSVADVDLDGKPDVIALSTTPSQLVWYKNPAWEKYTISSQTERNIDAAAYDVDGDGDHDLALACEFDLGDSTRGGAVFWLECPEHPETQQEWTIHRIDAVPTSHRVRWADVEGDGRKELLNLPIIGVGAAPPDYAVAVQFKAYTIPKLPRDDTWKQRSMGGHLTMAHGLRVVDWDNDGREDLLTASFEGVFLHVGPTGGGNPEGLQLGLGDRGPRPKQGASEVALGALRTTGGRFIATIEPWHGHQVVVYTPPTPERLPWDRTVIDDTFNDGHALDVADLDGDGDDEIIAGHRGAPYGLFTYRRAGTPSGWQRFPLDLSGVAAAGIFVADLNQDGRPDIAATGAATNNVVWYENRGVSPA